MTPFSIAIPTPALHLPNYDWAKHAAAVLDDEAVERAFADQAYSTVAQHAAKLMQPPHFLGFELIYSNDEKTRLVGIFAFRINHELIYAPAFFLNGQVRGQEILYRVAPGRTVPLTEEWISFLLEKAQNSPGQALPRQRTDSLNAGVDLTPLIYPQRNKSAAATQSADAARVMNLGGGKNPFEQIANTPIAPTAPAPLPPSPQASDALRVMNLGGASNPFQPPAPATPAPATPFSAPSVPASVPAPPLPIEHGVAGMGDTTPASVARPPLPIEPGIAGMGGTAPASVARPPLPVENGVAGMGGPEQHQFNNQFRLAHGTDFDPNSRVDRMKMKTLAAKLQSGGSTSRFAKAGARMPAEFFNRLVPAELRKSADWQNSFIEQLLPESASLAPTGLLRKFLCEEGNIKCAHAIAKLVQHDHEFAEACMTAFNGNVDMFVPAEAFQKDAAIKRAAATPKWPLLLHVGGVKNAHVKSAAALEQTAKLGFAIEDNRKDDDVSDVYAVQDMEMQSVSGPGVYSIPTLDGKSGKAVVATMETLRGVPAVISSNYAYPCPPSPFLGSKPSFGVIVLEPKKTFGRIEASSVLGRIEVDEKGFGEDAGTASPSAGNAYAIFCPSTGAAASEAFFVAAQSSNPNGTKSLVLCPVSAHGIETYSAIRVLFNPDAPATDFERGILNSGIKFIKLDLEDVPRSENEITANSSLPSSVPEGAGTRVPDKRLVGFPSLLPASFAIDSLMQAGIRKATIELLDDGRFLFDLGQRPSSVQTKAAAAAVMLSEFAFPPEAVEMMLEKSCSSPRKPVSIYFRPPAKRASAVTRIIGRPDFSPTYDGQFGTQVEAPRTFALQSQTDEPPIRRIDLNEVYDPTRGNGGNKDNLSTDDLLNNDPSQLAALQKQKNVPFVFEHGALGALVKTFDAVSMLEQYMPALEAGLDRCGRLLFLFYWKPQDFEKAFGKDDMADLEAELSSNFKSYGAMVLNLMRRSQTRNSGTPSLS